MHRVISGWLGYYINAAFERIGLNSPQMNLGSYVYMDPGVEVVEGVYLGSISTARNELWIRSNNIDAVVNLSMIPYSHVGGTTDIYRIDMEDTQVGPDNVDDYLEKFSAGVGLIQLLRGQKKKVLVHCAAGVNRSATLIAFFLIEGGMSYDEVTNLLAVANARRGQPVLTNPSFRLLLRIRDSFNRCFDPAAGLQLRGDQRYLSLPAGPQ